MAITAGMVSPRLLVIALPLVALLHTPARADDDDPGEAGELDQRRRGGWASDNEEEA